MSTIANSIVTNFYDYLPVVFGIVAVQATGKAGLLELNYEERNACGNAHAAT